MELRLLAAEEMPQILPLLQLLGPDIPFELLESRLAEMQANHYHCLGAWLGNRLVAISGFWILHKYYIGKHLEPDNFIVLPEFRDRGIGDQLLDWLERHATALGCNALELNCYAENAAGLRFWKARGFRLIGEHLRKEL